MSKSSENTSSDKKEEMFAWLYEWLITLVTYVLSFLGIQWSQPTAAVDASLSQTTDSSVSAFVEATNAVTAVIDSNEKTE